MFDLAFLGFMLILLISQWNKIMMSPKAEDSSYKCWFTWEMMGTFFMKAYKKQTYLKASFIFFPPLFISNFERSVTPLSCGICHISCSFLPADEVHCSSMKGFPSVFQESIQNPTHNFSESSLIRQCHSFTARVLSAAWSICPFSSIDSMVDIRLSVRTHSVEHSLLNS